MQEVVDDRRHTGAPGDASIHYAASARPPWIRTGVIALGLLLIAFAPTLFRLFDAWAHDPEYSHGFLMPLVAAWLLWDRKERLRRLRGGTSFVAVPVLLICLFCAFTAQLDFMTSLAPFAFVGALGAVLLAFLGWRGIGVLLPALVALVLACPLPGAVQQSITLPLKSISAQLAVGLLNVTDVPSVLEGSVIHLSGADSLWVAEACSGIRSLISLVSVAILACFLWNRHWGLRLAVVLAAVPIAVLVNGGRIWLTGWLSVNVGQETAKGAFHFFEGFALFAVAGLLLLGFAGLIGALFRREEIA